MFLMRVEVSSPRVFICHSLILHVCACACIGVCVCVCVQSVQVLGCMNEKVYLMQKDICMCAVNTHRAVSLISILFVCLARGIEMC